MKPRSIFWMLRLPFGFHLSIGNNCRWALDQGIYCAIARLGKNALQVIVGRWHAIFAWQTKAVQR